ncbi:MAG: ATP-binding protein [Pandoraea sp.]|nr:ATP-binding protein [Pandoraea sp.]MDR3396388.1 ATP-binding protein [Pandoraea sp.]
MLIFAKHSRKVLCHSKRADLVLGTCEEDELAHFCELALSARAHGESSVGVDWPFGGALSRRVGATIGEGCCGNEDAYVVALLPADELQGDQARAAYFAAIGHEIRTPLHGILGHLELLSDALWGVHRQRVDLIRRSLDVLLSLANNMLDVARIDLDMLPMTLGETDARALVYRGVRNFSSEILRKGLALSCVIDLDADHVWGIDEYRFTHILQNLLSNAVKFTERGEIGVHLSCIPSADGRADAAQLLLEVRDTGRGMTEDQHSAVSARFGVSHPDGHRSWGGSGMGLYLCDTFVGQMSGQIEIISERDVGSVIRVALPATRTTVANVGSHRGKTLEGLRILVRPTGAWGLGSLIRRIRAYGAYVALSELEDHDLSIELYDGAKTLPERKFNTSPVLVMTPAAPEQATARGDGAWELNSMDVQALETFLSNFRARRRVAGKKAARKEPDLVLHTV